MFGAYLAGLELLGPWGVYIWSAAGNLASNILIYYLGYSNGRNFIRNHPRIFHQELLPRVQLFYRKWGVWTLFFSRFLVGFRSVVPLFAGISRFRLRRYLLPVVCSIVIQHALIVYLGCALGRNWEHIKNVLKEVNLALAGVALVLALVVIVRFVRKRSSTLGRKRGR